MEFYAYEEMLEKALEKLPKKVETKGRFEIPLASIEFQGNKTLVRNFSEVVKTLRREGKHLLKYLFNQLATPGYVQAGMLILQSKISNEILQRKIEDYAKKYVICKECKNPDTSLIKEGRIDFLKCEACGAKYPVR